MNMVSGRWNFCTSFAQFARPFGEYPFGWQVSVISFDFQQLDIHLGVVLGIFKFASKEYIVKEY